MCWRWPHQMSNQCQSLILFLIKINVLCHNFYLWQFDEQVLARLDIQIHYIVFKVELLCSLYFISCSHVSTAVKSFAPTHLFLNIVICCQILFFTFGKLLMVNILNNNSRIKHVSDYLLNKLYIFILGCRIIVVIVRLNTWWRHCSVWLLLFPV